MLSVAAVDLIGSNGVGFVGTGLIGLDGVGFVVLDCFDASLC